MDSRKHPDEAEAGRRFRPDIEGLRAVAIVAVLLCHAGVPFLAGGYVGVDVFFVISGFLITRLLVGELDRSGTISLRGFYARRAKRLLPLSAVLLTVVAVLSLILLSPLRDTEVAGDITASALYVANWHFAAQSVDYFAQGLEPSPVLHLWSLAIEEQFYLVWPGLILATTWFWRRRGRSVRPVLWVVLALILAASLIYGVILTDEQPAFAYFSTFARAWELGLGAALALLVTVQLPRLGAVALGWAGVAAIVYASFAFTGETSFPGTAALVPTLGAAALILSGSALAATAKGVTGVRFGVANVLALPPVRYVGRISYSVVPLALAGDRLRRRDLGTAPLGRRRPRRGRRLLDPDPAHPHADRGPGPPRPGASPACRTGRSRSASPAPWSRSASGSDSAPPSRPSTRRRSARCRAPRRWSTSRCRRKRRRRCGRTR